MHAIYFFLQRTFKILSVADLGSASLYRNEYENVHIFPLQCHFPYIKYSWKSVLSLTLKLTY